VRIFEYARLKLYFNEILDGAGDDWQSGCSADLFTEGRLYVR
jgi:hypothetical protein